MKDGVILANNRIKWIDIAKFIAIIAVMLDHTNGILYTDRSVAFFSYYSVSLFIIVMGITIMWSYSNNSDRILVKVKDKIWGILRPYIVATIIYGIAGYKNFDFEIIFKHLIRFDMSTHFYYVLLYIQLILVSPLLFYVLERTKESRHVALLEISVFFVLICISVLTTNFSNIFDIYGGGGKLFGGTFIVLLYLGMLFGKYYNRISVSIIASAVLSLVIFCFGGIWWRFISEDRFQIDLQIPFGWGLNPPSVSLFVYSITVAALIFFLNLAMKQCTNSILVKMSDIAAFIGKHTLYIYLYHYIFISEVFPQMASFTGVSIDNLWLKRVVYFSVMIFGSMLIEYILETIHKKILMVYRLS